MFEIDLEGIFVAIGAFQGLMLAGVFLFLKRSNILANRFLGLISLTFAAYLIYGCLGEFGVLEKHPHLIRSYTLFGFLVGPLTYFYVCACVKKDFNFQRRHWLHFLPALIDIIYNVPFYNQDAAFKLAFYMDRLQNDIVPMHFWIQSRLKVFHALIYFAYSVMLVRRYERSIPYKASYIDNMFHRWLYVFCTALLVPLLMATIVVFRDFDSSLPVLVSLGFFVFLTAVQMMALIKPEVFHGFPFPIEKGDVPEEEDEEKYQGSSLQESQKQKYVDKVLKYMKEERPYLESELTLPDLSEKVNIPTHYLSQIINEKLRQNFMDFINKYRVEEAKKKLSSRSFKQFTILAIAYDVGFNSKSAFYNAFKKFTDTTPTKYRNMLAVST